MGKLSISTVFVLFGFVLLATGAFLPHDLQDSQIGSAVAKCPPPKSKAPQRTLCTETKEFDCEEPSFDGPDEGESEAPSGDGPDERVTEIPFCDDVPKDTEAPLQA